MTQIDNVTEKPEAKFERGIILFTNSVTTAVELEERLRALRRHCLGDWGDLEAQDKEANDLALQFGGRLLSAYHDRKGLKFWIITEADRSVTTVLLPDDY